ncbi:Major facilitator superfamily domain general substrate transporter [Penicillium fimorum]|uniref:Major facilitator superfamily domain general substrate transporter n=1 Tax=Penicillium fimorum TaxID=1882269 RepID=A0A9W9Y934_9EURO|nr:Major facilitator superfamily domain general substrate transporter [Penicillium fimorum]
MEDSRHDAPSPDNDRWRHSVEKEEDQQSEEDVITHVADPFGDESNAETKYRTLEWWQCGMIMIAETVSLGILSLPSAVAVLGLVPALILIVGLGIVATYTGYVIGQFKLRYPQVHSMGDAGELLFHPLGLSRFGREFMGTAQLFFLIFVMGSHLLTFSVMLDTVTDHATCSIVFGIVGLVVSFIFALPRTLRKVSWFSFASFASIIAALLITMIAIAIQRPGDGKVDATTTVSLSKGFLAVTNIVFAYAGHVAFFGFISEMKTPTDYPKTLYLLQLTDTSMYVIAAVVIYVYGGKDVKSPALSSTSPITAKIAYGIAIPTIVIAGVINGHVASKYVYVRLFRGTDHMHKRTFLSVGSWIAITLVLWVIAWIISEAIPVFNTLLSLITSLFASWFTYGLSGIFWLFLNRGLYGASWKKMVLTAINLVIVGIGACLCGMGLWVSGKAIHDDSSGASFSTLQSSHDSTSLRTMLDDGDRYNVADVLESNGGSRANKPDRSLNEEDLIEMPQNFPTWRKWVITVMLGLMTVCVTFASSVFSTATKQTAKKFGVSTEVMVLGVSLFVLGFAFGPIIFGPLSELYGRKRPMFLGMFVFAIFQIPVTVAQNLQTIFICRFLGGIFANAPLAIVSGILADMFEPVERGIVMAIFATATFIGPVAESVVGGFVTISYLGWRWTEYITAIWAFAISGIGVLVMPKAFEGTLLTKCAKRLRTKTKNWTLHAKAEEKVVRPRDIAVRYILRPFQMLVQEPILLLITLHVGFLYGFLYTCFVAYPISFQEERSWNDGVGALPFVAIICGVFIERLYAAMAEFSQRNG